MDTLKNPHQNGKTCKAAIFYFLQNDDLFQILQMSSRSDWTEPERVPPTDRGVGSGWPFTTWDDAHQKVWLEISPRTLWD